MRVVLQHEYEIPIPSFSYIFRAFKNNSILRDFLKKKVKFHGLKKPRGRFYYF